MQSFDWIKDTPHFSDEQLEELLSTEDKTAIETLRKRAVSTVFKIYKNSIYVRGLIEFSNYCKQGCYYCEMCIRDRCTPCREGNRQMYKLLEKFTNCTATLEAVSYTHLDVYKRQLLEDWTIPI